MTKGLMTDLSREILQQLDGDAVYALEFDIGLDSKKIDGKLVVTQNNLYTFSDDRLLEQFDLREIGEYLTEQYIGSASLLIKQEGHEVAVRICNFSQKHLTRYAQLCKFLEYHAEKGIFMPSDEFEERVCPKCGLQLPWNSEICFNCMDKGKVLLRLIKMAGPYLKLLALSLLCTVTMEGLGLLYPYFQRIIIDDYITPRNADGVGILTLIAAFVTLFLVMMVLEITNRRLSNRVSVSVSRDLRQNLFEKVQDMSMKNKGKRTAGELMKRISNDTMRVQNFISFWGKDAILRTFSFLMISTIMFVINWKLALLVLIPVPFVFFAITRCWKLIHRKYGTNWVMMSRASSILHDILNGIRVVKSYGTEEREIKRYEKASSKLAESTMKAEVFWFTIFPMFSFLLTLGEFLVLYFGGEMVLGREMQLGELLQYTAYVGMLYIPLRWAVHLPRIIADVAVSAGRIFEIIDEKNEFEDRENAIDMEIQGDVEFNNVSFGYKVYSPVLKKISFEIKKGEMIGIVGHSGVGKSTLINLLMHLYDVTDGAILIDGIDIRDISQQSLRSQLGVVLQETFLFEGTVLDNIMYSKPDATFEEVVTAAKIANAHQFISNLPDSYNTKIGNRGHTLSGGERQRIAIARAILHNPKILILDEATASLDTETEKQIQDALDKLISGRTTFAIAHRLSTLRNADRLIVLDQGKLAEIGTHEELMNNKSVYYNLVMAQRQTSKMAK